MPNFASWNPPAEFLQLGEPDRAHWSRRISSRFVWTTSLLVTGAMVLEGVVVYVASCTKYWPVTHHYLIYIISAVLLAFAGGAVVNAVLKSSRRPKFFYGFYPTGLVFLTNASRWGYLPWRKIYSFDQKYEQPILVMEDRSQIVITHDFEDPTEFYEDLTRYLEAKRRLVEEMPITASLVKYDKATRRQLLVGATLLGVTLAATRYYSDSVDMLLMPDRQASVQEWASATKVEQLPRAWLGVPAQKVIATPGQITSRRNGMTYVDAKVVLVPVGDRFLVASVRNTFTGDRLLRGEVSDWKLEEGPHGEHKRAALAQIAAEFPQYRDKLLPLQIDATSPRETHAQLIVMALAIGLVLGVGLLGRGLWSARHSRPRLVLDPPSGRGK